jgi:hypothetical protein
MHLAALAIARRTLCRLLSLALLLGLQACAQSAAEKPEFSFSPGRGTGVIVGSVTESYQASYGTTLTIEFEQVGGTRKGSIFTTSVLMTATDNDFKQVSGLRGTVYAVELPAGEYKMTGWEFKWGTVTVEPAQQRPIAFTVLPNEVAYLGNVHATLSESRVPIIGAPRIDAAAIGIRDEGERDAAVVRRKYPTLSSVQIRPRLLDASAWRNQSTNTSVYSPTIPVFIPR